MIIVALCRVFAISCGLLAVLLWNERQRRIWAEERGKYWEGAYWKLIEKDGK